MPSRLVGEIADRAALPAVLVDRLYALQELCYDGVDPRRFRADLAEKHWVILLREGEGGPVVGFSTQRTLEAVVQGRPVRVLFSGDTVIDPAYWGEQALVRAFCRLIGRLQARPADPRPLYWLLISKGHRTYLYLPTFFHEFWPCRQRPTPPFEAELIRALGESRYPGEFDAERGVIRPRGPHDRLKAELDASARRAANPHVAFFLERNPGHGEGDELVCVADLDPRNLRPIVRREVEAAMAGSAAEAGLAR
jgi:hypothetical protein